LGVGKLIGRCRWLAYVVESDRLLVQQGASVIAQLLNDILNEIVI
jgi:hypothetical protein